MAKKDPADKRKPVNVRPIERKHAGKIVEPYKIMEALIEEHHSELEGATILLCWRKGWKADVDKVLTLARMKKASDLDRAIGSRFADSYDFVMQLNEDCWPGLSDTKKRMVIDHELCHGAPDLDCDGEQKIDTRDRWCWRLRKHPIQEFPEIIERYGADEALGINDVALAAAENAKRPLLAAMEGNDNASPRTLAGMPIEELESHGVKPRQITALTKRFDSVGELVDHMRDQAEWWHQEVPGIGPETKAIVEDAVAAIQSAG
jgi:hypothetical protein